MGGSCGGRAQVVGESGGERLPLSLSVKDGGRLRDQAAPHTEIQFTELYLSKPWIGGVSGNYTVSDGVIVNAYIS